MVPFPAVMMSLYVQRDSSVRAIEAAMEGDKLIFMVSQRNQEVEEPAAGDLCKIGVISNVVRTLKLQDGRYKVLLQGLSRARARSYSDAEGYLSGRIEAIPPQAVGVLSKDARETVERIRDNLQVLVQNERIPEEMLLVVEDTEDPGALSDLILAHYKLEIPYAQSALEELNPIKRLKLTDSLIRDDVSQFHLSETIKDKARDELSKGQREYFLREQIKQIQRELGETDTTSEDMVSLKLALEQAKLPKYANTEAMKQYARLDRMHPESSEYALLRTYLEWIADLPWASRTKDRIDIKLAKRILDEDHFGLEKTKARILEYLSVRKFKTDSKGPILCLVGPPGVGKTSLGKSIARALNRNFYRISLGGVRDEAEIRGHRRTYVGALPGKVIQGLKQVKSKNPVIVLDELDKVGADFRGDPASALLEVLDPAQNRTFSDHYLNMDFDLSEVIFIATANTTDTIPDALLDRLEVIYIAGYTTEEKLNICHKFLVPRQISENGLGGVKLRFDDEALLYVIERYTREAGVRNLEREIGTLCRKMAHGLAEGGKVNRHVTAEVVRQMLGVTKFDPETNNPTDTVGLVRGLAWTIEGGEVMPVEASVAKGSGGLSLTGQLGDVMQESAQAAVFYARANARALGLDQDFHGKVDMHVHVPSGATPKDGPSAGITIATALISALADRKIAGNVAMTGEITLRGNVLPVGGLKEKAIAALRSGIKKVIIPFENLKDLEDIPRKQREAIEFVPVKHISEVLNIAIVGGFTLSQKKSRISSMGKTKRPRPRGVTLRR